MARKNDFTINIDKNIGKNMISLRHAKGITQQKLVIFIGVTPQQIQKFESRNNIITPARLVLIFKTLRVYYSYLYWFRNSKGGEKIL
jgi:transcriptional regulator with XRE-family HTH domain